jgi:hypothetical protein
MSATRTTQSLSLHSWNYQNPFLDICWRCGAFRHWRVDETNPRGPYVIESYEPEQEGAGLDGLVGCPVSTGRDVF